MIIFPPIDAYNPAKSSDLINIPYSIIPTENTILFSFLSVIYFFNILGDEYRTYSKLSKLIFPFSIPNNSLILKMSQKT
jgi:hypothetical protein